MSYSDHVDKRVGLFDLIAVCGRIQGIADDNPAIRWQHSLRAQSCQSRHGVSSLD
jgi:hypothetical protein